MKAWVRSGPWRTDKAAGKPGCCRVQADIHSSQAAPCSCTRSSAKDTLKQRPGQVHRNTAQSWIHTLRAPGLPSGF